MELRDYFKLIGKHLILVVIIIVLSGLGTFFLSKYQPKTFTSATTLIVNKKSALDQDKVTYYLFDNYYNVQSSGLFSQMVATWFESPALAKEIYEQAGLQVPDISQKALTKTFRAIREEPATIHLSTVGKNPVELEKLINAASAVIQQKINEMGKTDTSFYNIVTFSTITTENKVNLPLNTIIGLIAGLMVGIIAALGTEYFKGGKKV